MTRQLALDPSSGSISIVDSPPPAAPSGGILVRTAFSLISTGTELSKVDLASKPLWEKAQERPDQVRKVLEAVRTEGLIATAQKVRQRLAAPQPMGYSLSGTVVEVGEDCAGFNVGMRVACGGSSACHSELVAVPRNLAVPVPEEVTLADAAFATVASVALHGMRTAQVALGDRVLVIGLGLIGQLAIRLCSAAGAHVFGVDPRPDRGDLARLGGAEEADTHGDRSVAARVHAWSGGRGADVVLVTAGGSGQDTLELAGAAARDRARVVVVGAVDLAVPRETFYEKELTLVVSRSYGPGRYDPAFEEKGSDYPVGFVPWTERRNMEEILSLVAARKLDLQALKAERVPFDEAPVAYSMLAGARGPSPVAVLLEYESVPPGGGAGAALAAEVPSSDRFPTTQPVAAFSAQPLLLSFIGFGNFASAHLLPAVRSVPHVTLQDVVTSNPLKAETARRQGGFRTAGTAADAALGRALCSTVFIATRHDSHARYAEAAIRAGKSVFVEKPLALSREELDGVATAVRALQGRLMVGFNRRFAPALQWAFENLGPDRSHSRLLCRVNAGPLPAHHWLLDPEVGGGRLLGEGCHFLDLACHIARSAPVSVYARALDGSVRDGHYEDFSLDVTFANGATASIEYISGGDPSLAKERIEIHRSGTSVVIDDFRVAEIHRAGRTARKTWATRDKGHRAEVRAFLDAVQTGAPTPIPEEESLLSTLLTLAAARSVREGRPLHHGEW